MNVIKQDIQVIADFITSDRVTFKGNEFLTVNKMMVTLRDLSNLVPEVREVPKEDGHGITGDKKEDK